MSVLKPPPAPTLAARPFRHDYRVPTGVRAQIRRLQETSLPRTLATAVTDHAAILGLIALVLYAYAELPLAVAVGVNLVAWVGIARFQRGLECLVHEASHYNWERRRQKLNDRLANLFAAIPVVSTVEQYRVGHFVHHRLKGTEDDPCRQRYAELDLEALDRSSVFRFGAGIARRLPRYVIGWWVAIRATPGTAAKAVVWHAAVLVAPVWLLAGPSLAAAVWLQWMGAFTIALPVIRLIGEADEHKYIGADNVFDATMINDGWLLRLLIHPHNDGYHLAHHLWPGVPHHQLGRLHALLEDEDPEEYARRIRRRTRILEDPPPRTAVDGA